MRTKFSLKRCVPLCVTMAALGFSVAAQTVRKKSNPTAVAPTKSLVRKTFKTQPRDFVLYQTREDNRARPKFVVRIDSLKYPKDLSYRQFVPQGIAKTPEQVLALFRESIVNPRISLQRYQSLTLPADREDTPDLQVLRKYPSAIKDATFATRFDVANYSYLRAKVIYKAGVRPLLPYMPITTQQIGDRTYQSSRSIFDVGDPVAASVSTADENAISNHPVTDWRLPYKLQLAVDNSGPPDYTPLPPPKTHPLYILFDGKPMNLALKDLKANNPDPILRFLYKAWRVSTTGSKKEWLKLWTEADAKKIKANNYTLSGLSLYDQMRGDEDNPFVRVYFVMNLGPVASVFMENRLTSDKQSELIRYDFAKQGNEYRLANFAYLPNGKQTYSSNLAIILNGPTFETFLRGIAKQTADPNAKLVDPKTYFDQLPIPGDDDDPKSNKTKPTKTAP